MTPIKLEEAKTAGLDVVATVADVRRDIHIFVDYACNHEIKRGHRDNQLPAAHRQRLARLMSDPAWAARTDSYGGSPWIEHVDAVCLALQFVRYDTKGSYAGYSSSQASYPDNYMEFSEEPYEAFLRLPLQEQEERILNIHLNQPGDEFFHPNPMGRLNAFDGWGSATGVVPSIPFPKVRRRLLDLLAGCPSGVWFTTRSLIEHLRLHDPWFLIPERIPASAQRAIGSGRYANFSERKRGDWRHRDPIADSDPEGFAKVEGRYVERFLEGIPLLLGYIEVAYSGDESESKIEPSRGRLPAFRLTERLRPALRRGIAAPKVTVLPNFELHVESLFFPAKIEAELLALGDATQRGVVTIFKLAKPAVAEAMAANPTLNIVENLKQLSGRDLPANVAEELEEWAGHSEKFVLFEGFGLLEGRREEAGADGFVVETISPNFALTRSPEKLYQHLEATEQVPVRIRHRENALAAPAGLRSRLAPSAAPSRAPAKQPARIKRSVLTTLQFSSAEVHAAFARMLLDAKCVVQSDSRVLTISYPRKAEPAVKACLKKLGEQYAVAVEDIEK